MMYNWTADMVRFMKDASQNSDYFSYLADTLECYLSGCRTVCDAGCGLGQLSAELGKRGYQVTACDISKTAIEYVASCNYKNVTPVCCDLTKWTPDEKFDAIIFNYFGMIDQVLDISKRCCKKTSLVIKKNYNIHRFSFGINPIQGCMGVKTEDYLEQRGIKFEKATFSHEFGQPFKSPEDALLFFSIYSRDKDRSLINKENVRNKLEKSTIKGFEYYLPHKKDSLLFIIKQTDSE